ncbi:MAG: ABC transporter substrate-binding protein, partial [Porphyromonas sp.]|nr:ABC transporter substrate-binding protein [Porphyromonas sp.]
RVAHPQAVYIPVPARNLATSSSPHVGAVAVLGLQHVLVAVSDPEKVNDSLTRRRIQEGKVQRIGRGMSKDIERIIALNPDIYLQDLYSGTEKDTDLVASGINIVYFNNWKEQDMLGRAEWLKVIGLLYGRNAVADSAFRQMAANYQRAAKQAKGTSQIVPVMYGLDYKGVWYVPGEYSYIVKAFSDAAISCDFIPGQIDSRPSSFEYVFRRNQHKKIWLCLMTGKLEKLSDFLALNERYIHFDAAREGEVWVDRKMLNQEGGNDFWESGPYHPDLVLKDFIKIAHPELLPGYETRYWMRLR